jgi:catechol 2,3-dioxygenase-like lactoylglutathione lyase family enzyme
VARNRHSVATIRWITTAVALFAGLFLLSWGIGNGQRVIMVVGGALILLGLASRYTTRLRRNPRRWVTGTGEVVEVSDPPPGARFGRCNLQLVVDAPGMPAETVSVRHPRVPVTLWPEPGHQLPIQVAADDVRVVRVLWKSYVPDQGAADQAGAGVAGSDPAGSDLAGPGYAGSDPGVAEPLSDRDDEIDFDLDGPAPAGPGAPTDGRVPRPRSGSQPARPGRRPSPHPRPRVPASVGAGAAGEHAEAVGGRAGAARDLAEAAAEPIDTYPSAHPGPSGAIHGVGVTVLVTDLDRSAEFYRDRLGFYEMDSGEGNLVLASGETRLVLRQVPDIGSVTRRLVHLNFEVADIDAVYADLKAAGVRFTYRPRVVNQGARLELWAAALKDPDGHGVAITQWRPRTAPPPGA